MQMRRVLTLLIGSAAVALTLLRPVPAMAGEAERQAILRAALQPNEESLFARLLERRRKGFITLFTSKNPGKEQAVTHLFDSDVGPRIRAQWEAWFEAHVAFLASRLSDEDVAAYIAFRNSPAGKAYSDLNVRDDIQESAGKQLLGELGMVDAVRMGSALGRLDDVAKEAGIRRVEGK